MILLNVLEASFSDLLILNWVTVLLSLIAKTAAVLATILAGMTAYFVWTRRKYAHLPSPPLPSFFLGHLPDFKVLLYKDGDQRPLSGLILKWHSDLGSPPIFVVFILWRVLIFSFEPDHLKEMSAATYPKPKSMFKWIQTLFGERFLGQGLFSILDYNTWKPRRRLYDPSFKKSNLKDLVSSFSICADSMINHLKQFANGQTTVPIKMEMKKVTMEVICKVGFSLNLDDFTEDVHKDLKHKKVSKDTIMHYLVSHSIKGLQLQLNTLSPVPYQYIHPFEVQEYRESIRLLRKFGRRCIQSRIATLDRGDQLPNDILSHILLSAQKQESVDIEVLVDDFVTFFVAGHETTATLLTFTLIYIHQNEEILGRILEEIDEVVENRKAITASDLDQLKYTEQVFQETLRLCGPVPGTSKETPPDGMTLSDYKIPGKTQIFFSGRSYCKMSKYFEQPEKFDPDRFGPGKPNPSPFVYFPFGVGHRSCIGRHFAIMEAKIVLVHLLQTFKMSLPADYKLEMIRDGTVQPKGEVPFTLQPRQSKGTI